MKQPWTPGDIALLGLSSFVCGLAFFGTYLVLGAALDYDLPDGVRIVFVALVWICGGVALLAWAAAAIAKIIGIGVRSAND